MAKDVLEFFFDCGCLWAGNDATRHRLGCGPIDCMEPARLVLSDATRSLIEQVDYEHSTYLNPLYPPDPSLWSQDLCDRFNANVEKLIGMLRQELGADYDILDEQERYVEDPRLDAYLAQEPRLAKMNAFEEQALPPWYF
jgi:hypothetical protein